MKSDTFRQPPSLVEAVRQFLEELKELLGGVLVEVSVFGSTAKGAAHPDSDIDVLVIVEGDRKEALRTINEIHSSRLGDRWLQLAADGYVIELTVMGIDEWRMMLEKGFSFPLEVERDKLVVFRRG